MPKTVERDGSRLIMEGRDGSSTRPTRKAGPLRVAYASLHDVSDIRGWSGAVYFIARALEQQGVELSHVDQLQQTRLLLNKALNRVYALTGAQGPLPVERSIRMAKRFAREVGAYAEKGNSDVIFSPSSIPLSLLRTSKPKVFFTDATFADVLEQYPEFSDYPDAFIEEGHYLEREALHNCDLAIYGSKWAARSAVQRYGADPDRVKVVPFGSNIELDPGREHVMRAIGARPLERCELLFIGVNWERKGGPLAWDVARALNDAGLPTQLTVVGCTPPAHLTAPFMTVIPFVEKNSPWGQRRLVQLLLRSHFLLVPSIAECFGIVYAEASAMGVPSLARNVGGVSEAVNEGINGFLFGAEEKASVYVDRILSVMKDRAAYEALAHSAYQEYVDRLNWNSSGAALRAHLESVAGR